MVTIYLVRHGETIENCAGILQGCTPGTLSCQGKKQVEALFEELRSVRFDGIVSSDLKRAADSAAILNKSVGLPVELCPLLRERDWGSLTGMSCAEAKKIENFPDDVETQEHGMARASEFLNAMFDKYDGKTIIAVGHGFINRCILSVAYGISRNDVPRMNNAEFRIVHLYEKIGNALPADDNDEVSAN